MNPTVEEMLDRARRLLARNDVGAALRVTFDAGRWANRAGDEEGLEAVVALASDVGRRTEGRHRKEAQFQVEYFRHCIEYPEWSNRRSMLDVLKGRWWKPKALDRKTCPECAEPVRVEAKVCRFCGHRFEP